MFVKGVLFLVNTLMRGVDKALGWIIGFMEWVYRFWGKSVIRKWFFKFLKTANRLMSAGKKYLEQVGKTLRYRLYYATVTKPMKSFYRELRRRR